MIEYDTTTNTPRKIIIPVSSPQEILRYQQGVLGILGKIELSTIGPILKEDIKVVFDLLGHMLSKDNREQLLEAEKRKDKQKNGARAKTVKKREGNTRQQRK